MAYTVFARKYRPQGFSDVVGQEAVGRTLRNAVVRDRVAHAYLFAGPRGVGKTSMARILAKALNCAGLVDGEPCNGCDVCSTISGGRNFDVDEFDAASNRKVEDVERLLERVRQPRPVRGDSRCRVFIVDEVHMMTTHAFNALLKTLEEPPAHVKFIFATTEPEKVPETILSRCQRFDFRRIGIEDTVRRLGVICEREGIAAEERALRLIARRARGGMRDAQSLLDQAVALSAEAGADGATRLLGERLEAALGMAPRERVLGLLEAVSRSDVAGVLAVLDLVYRDGLDAGELCAQTAQAARDCMALCAAPPEQAARLLDDPDAARELGPLAQAIGLEGAIHILATMVELERRVQVARDERVLVELAFVKLARLGDMVALGEAIGRLEALEERATAGGGASPGGAAEAPAPARAAAPAQCPPAAAPGRPAAAPAPPQAPAPAAAPAPPQAPAPAAAPAPPQASAPAAGRAPAPAPAAPRAAAPRRAGPVGFQEAADALGQVAAAAAEERPALASVLAGVRPVRLDGETLRIACADAFSQKRLLGAAEHTAWVEAALAARLGARLRIVAADPAEAPAARGERKAGGGARRTAKDVRADPDVQRVISRFGGALLDYQERPAPRGEEGAG